MSGARVASVLCVLALCCAVVAAYNADEVVLSLGTRTYAVVNPKSITPGAAVIFFFHDAGGSCAQAYETGAVQLQLVNQGINALLVAPCGVGNQWVIWAYDDVSFTKAVLADVATKYPVDTTKAFAYGFSMGGMMVSFIACYEPTLFKGVQVDACSLDCGNPLKVNIQGIQGIQDPLCPDWVTRSYEAIANANQCDPGFGDNRNTTCKGYSMELHRVNGTHAFIDPPAAALAATFFKNILTRAIVVPPPCGGPPPTPLNGHFSCVGPSCVLVCDVGFAPSAYSGVTTCANGVWSAQPYCVPTGVGSVVCGSVTQGSSITLTCPGTGQINAVEYAAFGTVTGDCAHPGFGSCMMTESQSTVMKLCVGKHSCTLAASVDQFKPDPCVGQNKQLAVRVHCTADIPASCLKDPVAPAHGRYTCIGSGSEKVCVLLCDLGYSSTGLGYTGCSNGLWGDQPTCVRSGSGAVVCGIVAERATLTLSCPWGATFNAIEQAAYGLPTGNCFDATFDKACFALSSKRVVEEACIGKHKCSLPATNTFFGCDPCYGRGKALGVRARCSGGMMALGPNFTQTNDPLEDKQFDGIVAPIEPVPAGSSKAAVIGAAGGAVVTVVVLAIAYGVYRRRQSEMFARNTDKLTECMTMPQQPTLDTPSHALQTQPPATTA